MRAADVPTDIDWMMTKAQRLGEGGFTAMWQRPWRWLLAIVEAAAVTEDNHLIAAGLLWAVCICLPP